MLILVTAVIVLLYYVFECSYAEEVDVIPNVPIMCMLIAFLYVHNIAANAMIVALILVAMSIYIFTERVKLSVLVTMLALCISIFAYEIDMLVHGR